MSEFLLTVPLTIANYATDCRSQDSDILDEMINDQRVTYCVFCADRIYGWRTFRTQATSREEAIKIVVNHLGVTPEAVKADIDIELHLWYGLEP
jgi:hypothetical protein